MIRANILRFFTRNPLLKIISLVLAIILWLFVRSEGSGELGLVVPLELYGLSSDLIVTNVTEEAINVRINGPRSQTERLSTKDIRVRINLSSAKFGANSFDILPDNLSIPQGLRVSQISPSSIKVKLDKVVDKIVRVKAVVKGKPAGGYRVVKISVDPIHINLQGARNQLLGVREVLTEEVDISGLKESIKVDVPLRLSGLKLKQGIEKKVRVVVEIREEKGET
jgi:YbbR domain-containing protein